jgi:methyl-accepting chemotaxis protein
VGLIQTIEDRLISAISSFFQPVLTPLSKFWTALKSFCTALIDVIPATIALVKLIISEVQQWRNFKQNISFKRGVVNLQSVKDHVQDLIDEIVQAWNSMVHLFTDGFKLPVSGVEEMAAALNDLAVAFEDLFGKIGLQAFLKEIVPILEKAGGKVLEVLAIMEAVAEAALKVVNEINDVVVAVKDIRETFQTGEGLFLQQNNKRKTIQLADGGSIKVRLGNLH